MTIPTRKIGNHDVTRVGLGLMSLSDVYNGMRNVQNDDERLAFLDAAYAKGCTFWDSADIYGDSEDLLGKWFKKTGKRDEIFLATKFGFQFHKPERLVNGDPEYCKAAFERSLKRLGVDYVDLYYLHRADAKVPIEHTVRAMSDLVKAGKVKYLGLSEVSAATLRRAHAVHPIAAVQVEYSAFTLDIEHDSIGLLKTARELGVKIIAYSPLGRGVLTGELKSPDDIPEGDGRKRLLKFNEENFPKMLKVADGLKAIGQRHNVSGSEVALAWVLAQGDDFFIIPGTRKIKYLEENIHSAQVKLTPEEIEEVRKVAEEAVAVAGTGIRYGATGAGMQNTLFSDTPEL